MRVLPFLILLSLPSGPAGADALPAPLSDADYITPAGPDELRLGQLLFYDPILSGNRAVSCATCHHPRFATSDGLSLGLGDGGTGLGPERRADPANLPEQRIPRNSPALFNLGLRDLRVLFHDGRIEVDPDRPGGLRTPLDEDMVTGFSGLLSAQTMFPVLSPDEMAGHYDENEIALAVRRGVITGPGGAWDLLSQRVTALPEYDALFRAAYPQIAAGAPVTFADISNAIAAFVAEEWRSDASPFDAHLRGEAALTGDALAGLELFYGPAGCAACHAGPALTDQGFHAMGQPQIGPGKAARFESHQRDEGRFRVTGQAADLHAFRTPSLRNVAATGPWGHAGAFDDLRAFLRYHADPASGEAAAPVLPELPGAAPDNAVWEDDVQRDEILAARRTPPVPLSEAQIDQLLAFLNSLTDPVALAGRMGIPDAVPSGLPVER